MTNPEGQPKIGLLPQIWGHIWGKPLDVQKALKSVGMQLPDDRDPAAIRTIITELPDDSVREVANSLRLRARRVSYPTIYLGYEVKIPARLGLFPERLLGKQIILTEAPNRVGAYRETIARLYQDKYQPAPMPIIDTMRAERRSGQPRNLWHRFSGRAPYECRYALDSGRLQSRIVWARNSEAARQKMIKNLEKTGSKKGTE